MNKRIFLVNNKKKEPGFKTDFKKIAAEKNIDFNDISILKCAFSYSNDSQKIKVYHNKKEIDLKSSSWFIRAWSPAEEITALLSIILELTKTPFTDSGVNSSHEIRTSKLSQTFQLGANGCKCPSTWVIPLVNFKDYQKLATKELSFPIIVKARGGLGKRVWKCNNNSELGDRIKILQEEQKDQLVILQENIENNGDIRVVVWKGKVIASILRQSTTGFLNNVSQGGVASKVEITNAEKKLAIAASKAVRLDLAGVDLVRTEKETLIFEVNKAPDITSFHKAAGFSIAETIIRDYLKS